MRPAAHLSLGNPHAVVAVDDVDRRRPRRPRRPRPRREPRDRRARSRPARHHACGSTSAGPASPRRAAPAPAPRRGPPARWGLATPDADAGNHRAHGRRCCQGSSGRRPGSRPHRPGHLHRSHRDRRMSLIERQIREKIVLVGVTLPPDRRGRHRGQPRRAGPARRHRRRRRGRPASSSAATPPTRPTSSARARPRSCGR